MFRELLGTDATLLRNNPHYSCQAGAQVVKKAVARECPTLVNGSTPGGLTGSCP